MPSSPSPSPTAASPSSALPTTPSPNLPPLPAFFDWEAFRREGHKVVDFIADYHAQLARRDIPVNPTIADKAGFLPAAMGLVVPTAASSASPPSNTCNEAKGPYKEEEEREHNTTAPPLPHKPQPFDKTLAQIKAGVVPGMLHWQHPDFFGYFPAQLGPSAMLGEMIGAAMNTPGFSWASAPSASEMERLVMAWVVEMFGLPKDMSFDGTGGAVLQPSATEAAIVAILAAKNKKIKEELDKEKATADATTNTTTVLVLPVHAEEDKARIAGRLVAYVSDQAHFCIEKAAKVIGIPYFRKIPSKAASNDFFAGNRPICVDALKAAIGEDVKKGLVPFFVSANFGATGICAIDDIRRISEEVTVPNKLWLNVDGAYAGVVAMLPEFKDLTAPLGLADSLFINASKWMATMFNATLFFFKERAPIVSSLNATGVYLDNDFTASGAVVDYKDYHLGLGRPFRAIKLYTTLQSLGVEGLSAGLRRHIQLAKYLIAELKRRDALLALSSSSSTTPTALLDFPVEPLFGLVCFTLKDQPSEAYAMGFLKALNATNKMFAVHTVLPSSSSSSSSPTGPTTNTVVFRLALSYPSLTVGDMDRLASVIFETLAEYRKSLE